ncbi:hypothetical protein FD03_GL002412 [Companilactobacillus nodensis DSM 19682 = JCM 14932 = NBRC 107160]|uniref:Uncharacterized protein n=1 Tax=Companilactobacillus nodensis DSM 19682 = JCM 14932 = NBRC 107160 TaxID=1423775 RepID=A0A0R1K5J1_9LACO|nr:hypothetical protein [Companilactobacillus nodensis]KRK78636.1 hypothetical protein FD03_GL002412 [Companilactobacillus nodensis DSM 19682 = JCM 14932 = NBRC 107160]
MQKELRKSVIRYLNSAVEIINKTNKEILQCKKKLIKSNKDYQWIAKLYPEVFIEEYDVLLMNTSKFDKSYQSIVDGAKRFKLESELIDNSIIVMDEFDATKNVFLENILENSLKNKGNALADFMSFQDIFKIDITKSYRILKEVTHKKSIAKKFQDLKANFDYVIDTYHVDAQWYLNQPVNRREFVFYSGKRLTFSSGNNKLRLQNIWNKSRNEVDMKYVSKNEVSASSINIFGLFYSIDRFFNSVRHFVETIVKYQIQETQYDTSQKRVDPDYENTFSSVLSYYGIKSGHLRSLIIESDNQFRSSIPKNRMKELPRTNDMFDHILKLITLENRDDNRFVTELSAYRISETPEKTLANLAKAAHIIGLSATANIDSPLSNYDLSYLKEVLGSHFVDGTQFLTDETKERMKILNHSYENSNVRVNVADTSKINEIMNSMPKKLDYLHVKEIVNYVFSDVPEIVNTIAFQLGDVKANYVLKQYLEIVQSFKVYFENKQCQSFLCLTNKEAKSKDNKLDLDKLKDIFEAYNQKYLKNASLEKLNSSDFRKNKESILERLSQGENIYVLSTYQTIGDGQNLQYKPSSKENLIRIVDDSFTSKKDKRFSLKDFDGIYLGKVSYLTENLLDKNFSEDNAIRFMLQTEYSATRYYISPDEEKALIQSCLDRISIRKVPGDSEDNFKLKVKNLNKSLAAKRKVLKILIQSVGRLTRSFLKNEVFIVISSSLIEQLPLEDMKELEENNQLVPELGAIYNHIIFAETSEEQISKEDDQLKSLANNKTNYMNIDLKQMLSRINSLKISQQEKEDAIYEYEKMRELCLKYPTISLQHQPCDKIFNRYIRILDPTGYCFKFDVQMKKYKFEFRDLNKYRNLINEANSTLPILMKNNVVKKFFQDNGYATEFKPNDLMMNPVIFKNFYKAVIGEKAGEAIINSESNSIKISRYTSSDFFEVFDYQVGSNRIFIDFKNWDESYDQTVDGMLKKIRQKLDKTNADKVFVINIFADNDYHIWKSGDGKIIVIPALMNSKGEIYHDNVRTIFEEIQNTIKHD